MKRHVVAVLWLLAGFTQAQDASSRTEIYRTPAADAAAGTALLRVTALVANGYAVDLATVAPNASRHTGHVQGYATRASGRLSARIPVFQPDGSIDHPALCTLVVELDAERAKVVSAEGCAAFHGAGASFVEQGRAMVRVME